MEKMVSLKVCTAGLFWLVALGLVAVGWIVGSPYLAIFGVIKAAMAGVATMSSIIDANMKEIRGYFHLQEEARRLRSAR